VKYTNKPAQKH